MVLVMPLLVAQKVRVGDEGHRQSRRGEVEADELERDEQLHRALVLIAVGRQPEAEERHPLAGKHGLPGNIVMVFGPRDEAELAIVADLVRASHEHACGSAGEGREGA